MHSIINLYVDDSGSRHPDHVNSNASSHGYDWFSLGGVLIRNEDEVAARALITAFKSRWPQIGESPLHSVEIRHKTGNFRWMLSLDKGQHDAFFNGLDGLVAALPVTGIACVIDRPGYNDRYRTIYGRQRWSLCKTAFNILVERATKYALEHGGKLRILQERCSRKEDSILRTYYQSLKDNGHPFDTTNAMRYSPLSAEDYRNVLYEFKLKYKSSPLVQIADLFLWPMSIGGYHGENKPYRWLVSNGKLIDCTIPDEAIQTMGIKYSCFDLVKKT